MNLRDVIGTVALAYLPLVAGACPACPDGEEEQVGSLPAHQALALLADVAPSEFGPSTLCLDVCSTAVVEAPDGDVLSCFFDETTEELECVIEGEFGEERRRIPADRILTDELRWPGVVQGQLMEADQVANPRGVDSECELVLGDRLVDMERICIGPIDCSGAGRVARSQLGLELSVRGSPRSQWWARMATLEFAAVAAFLELAADLERLGAPSELVRRALDAAQDERVHTKMCANMAGIPTPSVASTAEHRELRPASLLEFARVNASEGCIRESFAALEALVQSHRASNTQVRSVLRRIARDETRHGQLSWDIDAWAARGLSKRGKYLVERSRRAAIRRTWSSLSRHPTCRAHSDVAPGQPSPRGRQRLFRGFVREVARSRAAV